MAHVLKYLPTIAVFSRTNFVFCIFNFATVGRQVWFEIMDWDFDRKQNLKDNTISDSDLYLALSSKEKLYPFLDTNVLTDGVYLSYGQFMRIYLKTGDAPNGRGFKGAYKTSK